MELHQTEKLSLSKGNCQQNKKNPPTEWDKIFANDRYDEESISKIQKELIQHNIKNPKQPD